MKNPKIETNLAFEFMCSLMGIAYYEECKKTDADISVSRFNHYISDFVDSTYEQIPNIVKKDIQLFMCDFSCMYVTLLDVILQEKMNSPLDLIRYFEKMKTLDFLNQYLMSNETNLSTSSSDEDLQTCLKDLSTKFNKFGLDHELFFEFQKYPEGIVERFIHAMTVLYVDFFKSIEDDLNTKLAEISEHHQKLYDENPDAFINAILFQSKESLEQEESDISIIVSSLYGDKVNVAYGNSNDVYFFYGAQAEKKLYSDNLTSQYEELIKSLADDTRRKLIKYLMNTPHYNKEISDYLGITTATISYHISRLTDIGIIHLKYQEGKRIYYQVDKERFNQLFDGLKRYLTAAAI